MGNETAGLPRDIAQEIDAKRGVATRGGVGSRAHENVGGVRARSTTTDQAGETASSAPTAETEARECVRCKQPMLLSTDWKYCAHCGLDLLRHDDPAKKLGLSFTPEDVQEYLFRGFVVRDVAIFGTHTVTLKTSQAKELRMVDDLIMNGEIIPKDKKVSEFYLRQLNSLCHAALSLQKIDGTPVGQAAKDPKAELLGKLAYLEERGSAFNDMVSDRVVMFNQAFTKYLGEQDTVLGS